MATEKHKYATMRLVSAALMTMSIALAACTRPVAQTSPSPAAADATLIRAVLDTMAVGWNRGDLTLYLSGYADDVTSRGLDGFVSGKSAARTVMEQGFWKSGRPLQALHYERVETRQLGSQYAMVTGEYVLTGGAVPERRGWFTTIWRRDGESWRCIHDHS